MSDTPPNNKHNTTKDNPSDIEPVVKDFLIRDLPIVTHRRIKALSALRGETMGSFIITGLEYYMNYLQGELNGSDIDEHD